MINISQALKTIEEGFGAIMTKKELKELDKIEFGRAMNRRLDELIEEYRIKNLRKKTGWKNPGKVMQKDKG